MQPQAWKRDNAHELSTRDELKIKTNNEFKRWKRFYIQHEHQRISD